MSHSNALTPPYVKVETLPKGGYVILLIGKDGDGAAQGTPFKAVGEARAAAYWVAKELGVPLKPAGAGGYKFHKRNQKAIKRQELLSRRNKIKGRSRIDPHS